MASIDSPQTHEPEAEPSYEDMALARHPDFDQYWQEHKNFVWWMAKRCSKTFGGDRADYLGTLTIHFNRCLHTYDKDRSKWVSYFGRNCYRTVINQFLKYESEYWSVNNYAKTTSKEDKKETHAIYGSFEADNYLYRVPDKDDYWTSTILDCFDTHEDAWRFMTRGLKERDVYIMERLYKHDETLGLVADRLQVTKQRVQQIESRALKHIRNRLSVVDAFACLFK